MAVGDVTSDERGSGARFNDGKPRLSLVPVEYWYRAWLKSPASAKSVSFEPDVLLWLDAVQQRRTKEPFLLLHGDLMLAVDVLEYGAKKYAAWNWAKGQNWSIPIDCALRHLSAYFGGEATDPESGLPHMGHVYCNVLFLSWFLQHYPEGDDLIPAAAFCDLADTGSGDS